MEYMNHPTLGLKIIGLRDPHGRDDCKHINPDDADLIFLPGDYVDVHERYVKDQMGNWQHIPYSQLEQKGFDKQIVGVLEGVLEMKYKYGEKIVLLLGNHDAQYIRPVKPFECYREQLHDTLQTTYHQHINQFSFVHRIEHVLFSHGGITNDFATYFLRKTGHHILDIEHHISPKNTNGFSSQDKGWTNLNNPLLYRSASKVMGHDEFPNGIPNGPLWTIWHELIRSPLENMVQIFGHHHRSNSAPIDNEKTNTQLYCVDAHWPKPFHEISL